MQQKNQFSNGYTFNRIINGCWQLSAEHCLQGHLDIRDALRAFHMLVELFFNYLECTEFFTGGKTHLVSLHPFSRNADFVEFVAIFGKGCIQDLLSGIFYGIALHTDKREINYEILLVGYFDTVLAVGIDKHAGQSTFIFVLHKNAGSGKRFA